MTILRTLAAALLAMAVTQPAMADSPPVSSFFTGINGFVNGNFTTGHDVEGPVIVGGNLSGNGTFFNLGLPLGVSLAGFGSVNVYGSAAGSSYNANGLQVKVGGANTGTSSFSGGTVTYNASFPATKTEMWSQVTTLSAGLAALAPTTPANTLPGAGSNNAVITATPGTVNGFAGIAVIDIAASLLGSYTGVSVNVNGANTVIINVAGNYTGNPNFMNGVNWRSKVIWNFENATSVNLGAQGIQGSVLAPFAAVSNGTPIDGALVAASFNGGGELHFKPFTGNTGFLNSFGAPSGGSATAVPEPGSLALMGGALAGLAAIRRRRRR